MRAFLFSCFLTFASLGSGAAWANAPVEAYAQLPGVLDSAISPDGKAVASIVESGGQYVVSISEVGPSTGKPKATGLGEGVIPLWVKWANNDRLLVSVQQTHLRNNSLIYNTGHIYTLKRDMSDASILIKQGRSKRIGSKLGTNATMRQFNNIVVDFLANDPDHILMAFSDDNAYAPDVQKVNVATGKYEKVQNGIERIQQWVTDLTGTVRVGQGLRDLDNSWTLTIRESGDETWRSGDQYPGLSKKANIVGFTENPNEMIVASYRGGNTLGLFIYDLGKKSWGRKLFQHDKYDVSDIVLSPDGSRVIGAQYLADNAEIEFFEPTAKVRMDRVRSALQGYTPHFVDQTQDGKYVLLRALSPDTPAATLLFDTQTNTPSVIGSDYPKLSGVQQGDVNAVRYTARDGTKIPAYVTLPHKVTDSGGIKDVPFIILPHGGPYARDTSSFDYLAQFFANRGYGVLQMNFRGSTGYGLKFQNAGRDNWVVMQDDVEDGTRWLIEKGYADPERICIMGWSYGGFAALMGAAKTGDLYQCAISMAGVTDLQDQINDSKKYRFGDYAMQNFILRGFDSKDDIRANSPVKLADDIKIPVLIAHGTHDAVVHFDQYRRMERALKKAGADYEAIRLKDSDHSLRDSAGRMALFTAMDKFLEQHLGKSEYAP